MSDEQQFADVYNELIDQCGVDYRKRSREVGSDDAIHQQDDAVIDLACKRIVEMRRELAEAQREAAQLRRIAIDAVNETDGWCREDVSIAFLCGLANEVAGIKKQRDEVRRKLATRDAHVESMLRFIGEVHDYLRGNGNPDLPAWVLAALAQEILDCVPVEIRDPAVEVSE